MKKYINKEFELFEGIEKALGESTPNNNRFKKFLDSVNWDNVFYADEEHYFLKDGAIFTTPSLNPFDMEWEPSFLFSDGYTINL